MRPEVLRATAHVVGKKYPENQASPTKTAQDIVGGFKQMFDEVNSDQVKADEKIEAMATGRSKDIPGTIMAMEKAEVSLKMLMAVRGKIVTAYEEIMRMQV